MGHNNSPSFYIILVKGRLPDYLLYRMAYQVVLLGYGFATRIWFEVGQQKGCTDRVWIQEYLGVMPQEKNGRVYVYFHWND